MGDRQTADVWVHDTFGVHPGTFAQPDAPPERSFDRLYKAADRVVPPGPALDAQTQLKAALDALKKAIAAGDEKGGKSWLTEAQRLEKIIMKAPDPAMMPVVAKQHPDEVLYGKGPGETTDVSETDINQGSKMGDCYLLSSIGEIARIDPNLIKKMIKDNGDGTYTVTLHQEKSGIGYLIGKLKGQEFEDVKVTVDGDFAPGTVNSGAGQDEVGGKKEIWVQVLEKAYAKLHGGYNKIQGGHATDAMEALTGKKATYKPTAKVTVAELQAELAKGKPVVMDTKPDKAGTTLPFNMVEGHAYMLDAVITDEKGKSFVKLRNPWGFKQPNLIPFDQLGTAIDWVDEGSIQ